MMTRKIKKTQSSSTGFSERIECVYFGFRLITKPIYENEIINIFFKSSNIKCTKNINGFLYGSTGVPFPHIDRRI